MSDAINDGGPAFPSGDGPESEFRHVQGMTLRQYAAIHLRVPDSGEDWLDDMIREAQRDAFAWQALAGMNTAGYTGYWEIAEDAYAIADAMLLAREAK